MTDIKSLAKITLKIESEAIHHLISYINDEFVQCVEFIFQAKGRLIVSGIGKSAIIGQKIVATLNSTGTPAVFMHAADAIHGDLGMVQPDDVVMVISKSGNTPEIKVLLPFIQNLGNKIVGMVGNIESELAQKADFVINTTVSREACPNNLAPTTSTTAQLAMGDTLAICLLQLRGFSHQDFARFHPGGALGKQLYLRAGDLAAANATPQVAEDENLKAALFQISAGRLGMTAVVNNHNQLVGIITDGDIRRLLSSENSADIFSLKAGDVCTRSYRSVEKHIMASEALHVLRTHQINQLIVTHNGNYFGVIHLQDLIKEGII